jgi:dihydroxyacetone kinase-like protein
MITKDDVLHIIHRIRLIIEENHQYLIELDSLMGDGDLGLTMKKAFVTADEEIQNAEETDCGKIFMRAGMVMAKAAPSTMGTLVATGFMRGGKAVSGKSELDTAALSEFFTAFANGIMERGKSSPGDKTIVDVIKPVADALTAHKDKPMEEALQAALDAAQQGLEATKEMAPKHGKIYYHQQEAKGRQDPGGTVGVYIMRGFLGE